MLRDNPVFVSTQKTAEFCFISIDCIIISNLFELTLATVQPNTTLAK
jgi:hypothetical protein